MQMPAREAWMRHAECLVEAIIIIISQVSHQVLSTSYQGYRAVAPVADDSGAADRAVLEKAKTPSDGGMRGDIALSNAIEAQVRASLHCWPAHMTDLQFALF